MLVGLALAAVGGIVAYALIAPTVDEAKRNNAAAERREAAEHRARLIARLKAEQRPRRGRAPQLAVSEDDSSGEVDALRRRRALVRTLEADALDDARARVKSGEFRIPVRTMVCERFPRRATGPPPEDKLDEATGLYECLALTSRIIRTDDRSPGAIGYPYRARANFTTGAYAFCKISGRPGEGGLQGQPLVPVPRVCGGS